MAELDKYPVPLYDPNSPYHWSVDNLPLETLATRDEAINGEVENIAATIRDANGTQGTLANRLNQSINPDGSLKADAVDESLHSIAEHTDDSTTLTTEELETIADLGYVVSNPVPYVRMLEAERAKLSLIADEATNIAIQVETPSNAILFEEGAITFASSASITWEVNNGNEVKANLGFPIEAAHRHYYGLEPITTDYQNYKVTSVSTPYMEGTLRVFINGFRIAEGTDIYIPGNLVSESWTLNSFTPDHEAGTFELANAITEDDAIWIDFDVALT
jgi:hypothetical protein